VLYILTGQRSSPISPEEESLLYDYRNSSAEGKDAIKRTAFALSREKSAKRA
jgi:hypothetical protein